MCWGRYGHDDGHGICMDVIMIRQGLGTLENEKVIKEDYGWIFWGIYKLLLYIYKIYEKILDFI